MGVVRRRGRAPLARSRRRGRSVRAGGRVGEGVGEAVDGRGPIGVAHDCQGLPGRSGAQPPGQPVGVLHPPAVLRQPQPSHLDRVDRVGVLQPKRPYPRPHHPLVAADDLLPGERVLRARSGSASSSSAASTRSLSRIRSLTGRASPRRRAGPTRAETPQTGRAHLEDAVPLGLPQLADVTEQGSGQRQLDLRGDRRELVQALLLGRRLQPSHPGRARRPRRWAGTVAAVPAGAYRDEEGVAPRSAGTGSGGRRGVRPRPPSPRTASGDSGNSGKTRRTGATAQPAQEPQQRATADLVVAVG